MPLVIQSLLCCEIEENERFYIRYPCVRDIDLLAEGVSYKDPTPDLLIGLTRING